VNSLPAWLSLSPDLQILKVRSSLSLLWGASNAVLQQADAPLPGLWNVVPGATSPFGISGFGPGSFFRLAPAGPP
jgi:hypothetical protein